MIYNKLNIFLYNHFPVDPQVWKPVVDLQVAIKDEIEVVVVVMVVVAVPKPNRKRAFPLISFGS